ncbi:MAG: FecR domain-containing protein [Mesorhizobium sp.]|nr:FecR domain-containing protein [Mesorhizobium sp.]MBN9217714.1 FecR domain-containing protein [Mesorhizobium sp.]
MTGDENDEDRLFEEAADLAIRLQNEPASPVAHELVQQWRARGPAHEAAWAEVAEIRGMAGKVFQDRRDAAAGEGMSRRKVILTGLAGFAALGAGAIYGPDLLLRLRADQVTTTAELRKVTLADGSVVTLGPDSAMRSTFTPAFRHVELLAGMAFFEVAPDAARPFRVEVETLTATALGTAFDVSRDAGSLTVSVAHGLVEVAMPESPLAQAQRLAEGDWLALDDGEIELGKRDASQIAAWRDGFIVADRETVSSVVARIARWKSGRVVIADAGLGAGRISGVFDLTDPLAALEAVVQPYQGKVRRISPWLTVISSI